MTLRLFINEPLSAGALCELTEGQCNYLFNVMRMKEGQRLHVFNGKDGEWVASISSLSRKRGDIRVETQQRGQVAEPDLWLLFAPIKQGRIDWLVEKATELGVQRLLPIFTKHTVMSRVNTERLRAHAVEAAEQSERLSIPEIAEPIDFALALKQWDKDRKILLCDETGGGQPILKALEQFRAGTSKWALFIGPEGGFSAQELEKLKSLPYVLPVGLGPRVLRADTAALAAITCWQAMLGDWHGAPRFQSQA